ncbi:PREDICTED: uncharacterized protein LOC107189550 [Dufourea novaeangliae]|uniref:uncharacterized protein LOC107189550 n=1 Tax=Dufourea novaeangliae TaxID=178035 RepID=UPI0007674AF2|nr:PREDICTED: uncharacterized protein LOC107189550 [Dufourea novaeangliae]
MIFVYLSFLAVDIYTTNFLATSETTSETIQANLFLLFDGFVILMMYALSYTRFILLQKLTAVTRVLSQEDFNDMAKLFHTKDIFGIVLLLVHIPNCYKGITLSTLQCMTTLYIVMVHYALDMFYMNCVCLLRACFKRINEDLNELNKPLVNLHSSASRVEQKHGKSLLLLMKLKHLEDLHLQISDVVEILNKTFLARIVVMTVSTFTVVTFNVYFYLLWSGGGFASSLGQQFWYIRYVSAALYYLLKFSLVIWACQTATNQAKEIGTTIHDVLSKCTDGTLKRELRLFSLQVLHRDNTFSARAVIMNTKLLAQIIGGILMYIMILLQFFLNSVVCKLKYD